MTPAPQEPVNLSTLGPNLIRTYVPILVGTVVSWLTVHGVHLQAADVTQAGLIAAMTSALTAGYYTVVRVLEERWPSIGLLLGARQPGIVQAAEREYEEWPPEAEAAPTTAQPVAHGGIESASVPLGVRVQSARPVAEPAQAPPGQPASPGLADLMARTPPQPLKPRGPITGAIPVYRTPPGR